MRVATKTTYDAINYQLMNITEALADANEVVATEKRINSISDDPTGLSQVLAIRSEISNLEQLETNITLATSWLESAESALTSTQDILTEAQTLCVEMANTTESASSRESAATTVENLLAEIVTLANTEVAGRYIFAGTASDSTPFEDDGTYNGTSTSFSVKIGKDSTLEIGSDGSEVFDTIFSDLQDLITALENNDVSEIQSISSELEDDYDHITAEISDIGAKTIRVEIREQIIENLELANSDRLSAIEDADITTAITDLAAIEVAYEAALSAASQVMQVSLVDYL